MRRAAAGGGGLVLFVLAFRDLLFWDPTPGTRPSVVEDWFFQSSETAPQLVLLLSLGLLATRWRGLREALSGPGAARAGALWCVAGLPFFLWGHYVSAPDLLLLALLLFGAGAALLLGGRPLARMALLPGLLLLFAIPLPGALTNSVVHFLQLSTGEFASWILSGLGVPALREGDMLVLASRNLEVIESCAGLRAIAILSMLAVGYVAFFQMGRLQGVLLVAAAPLIGFLLNGLRVVALALDPDSDVLEVHVLQGVILFVAGAICLVGLDRALLRVLPGVEVRPPSGIPPKPPSPPAWPAILTGLALLAGLSWLPRWDPEPSSRAWSLPLPGRVEDWRSSAREPIDRYFFGSVRFSWFDQRSYESPIGAPVSILVASDDRSVRARSLVSPKLALPGAGWAIERQERVRVGDGNWPVLVTTARSGPNRRLTYTAYAGTVSWTREVWRAALALDQSPLARPEVTRVVRVSTYLGPEAVDEEEAHARLRMFLKPLGPAFFGLEFEAGSR